MKTWGSIWGCRLPSASSTEPSWLVRAVNLKGPACWWHPLWPQGSAHCEGNLPPSLLATSMCRKCLQTTPACQGRSEPAFSSEGLGESNAEPKPLLHLMHFCPLVHQSSWKGIHPPPSRSVGGFGMGPQHTGDASAWPSSCASRSFVALKPPQISIFISIFNSIPMHKGVEQGVALLDFTWVWCEHV